MVDIAQLQWKGTIFFTSFAWVRLTWLSFEIRTELKFVK